MNEFLVIGGTGKTGRRVASRLRDRGLAVRCASRPTFDWTDESTWLPTVSGASAAYVTFAPDLAFPGGPEAVSAFARVAARAGVRRLVLLSGRGEPEAERAERLFAETAASYGAEWAVVRSAFFMQNFDESLFVEPLTRGLLAFPADGVREPFVDLEDLADVATALLVGDAPDGQVYEVTGPRLLTFAEATAEIGEALGRPIGYRVVSTADFVAELVAAGLPGDDAAGLGALFAAVLDGRNAHLADGVRRALGREPRDLADYAKAAAAEGSWS